MIYAFNDSDPEDRDYKPVKTPEEAAAINTKGYGIFHTVNEFKGARKISNLTKIKAWYADLDDYDLPIDKLLKKLPLYPTTAVKTKSGYHLYFDATNASMGNYKIIGKRIVHALGAKESVYDLARLLRVPGFYHLKDPNNPFLVKTVFQCRAVYSETIMMYMFKPHPDELKKPEEYKPIAKPTSTGDTYFDKIHNTNQEMLLRMLSGKACVRGESYSFKQTGGGKKNILVNGKSTPCWIDRQGRIGSQTDGGPSVYQWLKWFGYSHSDVMGILKQEIGEL